MSFWIYIDSLPLNTNSSYLRNTPLLSYGDNPTVKYEASTNTLTITVEDNDIVVSNTDENTDENTEITTEQINEWNKTAGNKTKKKKYTKSSAVTDELDADGHRIIYMNDNWLLQKWNNIVFNYNGGTLDVFVNGELVKSAIQVVPYMTYDMLVVGADNGIVGEISNLVYFKKPIDVMSIYSLYHSFKDKNPPSLNTNKEQLVNIPT